MIKLIVQVYAIIFVFNSYGQPVTSFYLNSIGNADIQFSDDDIYLHSNFSTLIKSDYSGNISWTKTITSFRLWSIDENSIFILDFQNVLSRLDTSGNIIWSRDLTGITCMNNFWKICCSRSNVYLVSSHTGNSGNALATIDSAGNLINSWCDFSGDDVAIDQIFPSITGGVWISHLLGPGAVGYEACMTRTLVNGDLDTLAGQVYYQINQYDNIVDVIKRSDSTYIVIDEGTQQTGPVKYGIKKIDEAGNLLWEKIYLGFDTSYRAYGGGIDSLNNLYFVGTANDYWGDFLFMYSLKLDPDGNVIRLTQWSNFSPELWSPIYRKMKFRNNQLFFPVEYYDGNNTYPSVIVLDTMLSNPCLLAYSYASIAEIPPGLNKNSRRWFTNTNPIITPSTVTITSSVNPPVANLCIATGENMAQEKAPDGIMVYPTPWHSEVQIHLNNFTGQAGTLNIFNSLGEKSSSYQMNTQDKKIDVSELPTGIYLLSFQTQSFLFTGHFLKQ